MTRYRLPVLFGLLCLLVLFRIVVPPREAEPAPIVQAVVRSPASPAPDERLVAASSPLRPIEATPGASDIPGNAFSVKAPPAPPVVAALPAKPVVAPPPPLPSPMVMAVNAAPPPSPSPFQVIGTWDDGTDHGVFLSSSSGVLLARNGTTLQAEYKVTEVTAQQISFVQIASGRVFKLAVQRPASSPSTLP